MRFRSRPEECVAEADARIEERQWKSGFDDLHPEAPLAQIHGHRIEIDAVEAATDDLLQGASVFDFRGFAVGREACDVGRHASSRREEKVASSARWIKDGKVEERLDGLVGIPCDGVGDGGFECAVEHDLDETVGRVVAPGRAPRVAVGLVDDIQRDVRPFPLGHLRPEIQETLVDVFPGPRGSRFAEFKRTVSAPTPMDESLETARSSAGSPSFAVSRAGHCVGRTFPWLYRRPKKDAARHVLRPQAGR